MKPHFTVEAKSLLQGLLEPNPEKRIGASKDDALELMRHPWFKNIDWDKLYKKEIPAPFKPYVTGPEDLRNIDKMFLNEPAKDTPDLGILSYNTKEKNHFE